MTEIVRFTVKIARIPDDQWLVQVDCRDGSEYAKTLGPNVDVALRMAVPYMASLAEPDPFADLLRDRLPPPTRDELLGEG